jgi:hypothetical protein
MKIAGVGMEERHWKIVQQVAASAGHSNNSAALRSIVERHHRTQQLEMVARAFVSDLITAQEAADELARVLLCDDCARE